MTPEKLAKIRRLAEDVRGDPATRAIAQAALKRYAEVEPEPEFPDIPPFVDTRHEGMKTSPEYDRFRFMDLGSWKTTVNGNPTYVVVRSGKSYRIVLYKYKKSPFYGWMRINTMTDETVFTDIKYKTMGEAHSAAWNTLMAI